LTPRGVSATPCLAPEMGHGFLWIQQQSENDQADDVASAGFTTYFNLERKTPFPQGKGGNVALLIVTLVYPEGAQIIVQHDGYNGDMAFVDDIQIS
jgi:hypothetical protein